MLREASVTYSSVPQEEGIENVLTKSFITPEYGGNPPNKRTKDCQIVTCVITVVCLMAGTVAVVLPIILNRNIDNSVNEAKESPEYFPQHINPSSNILPFENGETILQPEVDQDISDNKDDSQEPGHDIISDESDSNSHGITVDSDLQEDNNGDKIDIPKLTVNLTDILVKPDNIEPIVTQVPVDDEQSGIVFAIDKFPIDNHPEINPANSNLSNSSILESEDIFNDNKLQVDEGLDTSDGNIDKTMNIINGTADTNDTAASDDLGIVGPTIIQLLNDIYGDLSEKQSLEKNSTHGMVPLGIIIGCAIGAALGLMLIIIGIVCIICTKVKQNRRRVNLQTVVTDLQFRDKIVLLDSGESGED